MKRPLALAAALVSLAAPSASDAYVIGGKPWPGGVVTYYTQARGYSAAVNRAAKILNGAGVNVHLRRASSRASADVVVTYHGNPCEGEAAIGFTRVRANLLYLGAGCSHSLVTLTAVHELGHVLGLDHETRRCARMNPTFDDSGTPGHCRPHSLKYWLAHPLTADDLRGLRALYVP
jgi:hypothetical protein